MPEYTLRTHPSYTLTIPGHEHPYRDGDRLTISEEDARRIAYASKWHRFEASPDEPPIGHDRHRSGRHLRGQVTEPPPAGSDQDTSST